MITFHEPEPHSLVNSLVVFRSLLIFSVEGDRSNMKVLVLGLPRTGTQSLADALTHLGFGPVYHMRDVGKNNHQGFWIEAIEVKFESPPGEKQGPALGRKKFDTVLAGFEGVADFPAAIFPEELLDAYPEAAVVLSTRDEDGWYASMMSTLWHHHTRRREQLQATRGGEPLSAPQLSMARLADKYHHHCWNDDFPAYGRETFRRHNALVKESAARTGRRFLEYRVGEGWDRLCEFLGVAVPQIPFPRSDDWAEYKKMVALEKSNEGQRRE
ncbi:hypothetical protein VTK73DRAFT_6765 [Phialemonium thermophilum]|uniref:Sulfotransferase family protein n=1 Tax=Phialemonium thermophilum TaxID=223376 RepID=A0ABR3WI66_9PEZI